jgi:hypothetical protein
MIAARRWAYVLERLLMIPGVSGIIAQPSDFRPNFGSAQVRGATPYHSQEVLW